MKTFKTFAIAALAAGVAGTALTTSMTAYAKGGQEWGRGNGPHGCRMMTGPHDGMRGSRLMERFDINDDGVVSQAEVDEAAAKRFTEADTDGNGSIDLAEVKAAFAERSKDRQVRAFQRLDKDGDGSVTDEEFNAQTDRLFARLDRDGNGELEILRGRPGPRMQSDNNDDSDENATAGRGMSPGQGQGMRWRDDDKRGSHHGWGWGRHGRDGGDRNGPRCGMGGRAPHGRMGFGMGPMGHKGHMGPMGGPGPMAGLFEVFDTDNDGKITREEFTEVRGQLFASADADKSGSFTLEDFSGIWMTLHDGHAVRMFQGMDKDGDLKVTAEEHAERTQDLVKRLDRNGDGVITSVDFAGKGKGHHGSFGPGPHHGGPRSHEGHGKH